ncbi:hypothetical protein FXO38_14653 [Capsicum annuum]|nr:hypothetical protein FXO38_14653 [Capsicum annuum]
MKDENIDRLFKKSCFGCFLELAKDALASFPMRMIYGFLKCMIKYVEDNEEEPPIAIGTHRKRSKVRKCKEKIDGLFDIARHGYKLSNLLKDLMDKTIPKLYREKLCLVWFAHSVILARDVNKVIEDDLLVCAEDFDKFNNYPWGYDNFYLTAQYLLTKLSSGLGILNYSSPPKAGNGLSDEVSHPGMFRWLAVKSNTKIKEADLFNLLDDLADPGVSSGGGVGVGDRNDDASTTHDDEHVDGQEKINMFENTLFTLTQVPFTPFYPRVLVANTKSASLGAIQEGGNICKTWCQREEGSSTGQECQVRKRQLTYLEAYDTADRIMDLNYCKKIKDKYDQLNNVALEYGERFDFLVSTLDWDEDEMITHVRVERPNPRGKSWTEAKRILVVISINDIHYNAIEILFEEGKIKIYDCNDPLIDDVDLFLLM